MTSVLAWLGRRAEGPATRIAAPRVAITSFATDSIAAPGTRFSRVLDVVPERRVHIYAPGVTGYKPIALSIEPSTHLVVQSAHYPKSTDYFFKPLKEQVRMFRDPFRIVQDVMLSASRESEAALAGREQPDDSWSAGAYQACDDTVCFTPQSIPLEWTVGVRPLDRERSPRR